MVIIMTHRFWEKKTLQMMDTKEWESLCDGCGKCCLEKLIDDETNELCYTTIACQLLDPTTCDCKSYLSRFDIVEECLQLTKEQIDQFYWLPNTCAYRLLQEGKPLPDWHPLLTGSKKAMHQGHFSAKHNMVHLTSLDEWEDHVIYRCTLS